nr:hypothetical protein [Alphaproteobacteria bacterium]
MARRPNERGRKSKPVRRALNPARQLWLALAAVAALGLGYLVAAALDLIEKPAPVQSGVAQSLARTEVREPWYKTQSPPPELVSGPNA